MRCTLRMGALGLGVLQSMILAGPALAQPNPPAQKREAKDNVEKAAQVEKVTEAFDEIEAEIESLEKASDAGGSLIDNYADELRAEYFANQKKLASLATSSAEPQSAKELTAMRYRQKMIPLYLWELERVKPFVGTVDNGPRSLTNATPSRDYRKP